MKYGPGFCPRNSTCSQDFFWKWKEFSIKQIGGRIPEKNTDNAQKKGCFFLWLCPSSTIVFARVGSKTCFRQKYWRFNGKGMHGDQDWLTLLSWKMPANFSPLSCAFNHVISMVSFHPKIWLWVCKVFQDNEEEIDLSSEAGCERAKIIHRTSSIDNSF